MTDMNEEAPTTELQGNVTGSMLGHIRAKQAANKAGNEWKEKAYKAFEFYALSNKSFKTEDVRNANSSLPPPPDKRAWGQVALTARRNKIIVSGGYVKAENLSVHGMVVTLWISTIFKEQA